MRSNSRCTTKSITILKWRGSRVIDRKDTDGKLHGRLCELVKAQGILSTTLGRIARAKKGRSREPPGPLLLLPPQDSTRFPLSCPSSPLQFRHTLPALTVPVESFRGSFLQADRSISVWVLEGADCVWRGIRDEGSDTDHFAFVRFRRGICCRSDTTIAQSISVV